MEAKTSVKTLKLVVVSPVLFHIPTLFLPGLKCVVYCASSSVCFVHCTRQTPMAIKRSISLTPLLPCLAALISFKASAHIILPLYGHSSFKEVFPSNFSLLQEQKTCSTYQIWLHICLTSL